MTFNSDGVEIKPPLLVEDSMSDIKKFMSSCLEAETVDKKSPRKGKGNPVKLRLFNLEGLKAKENEQESFRHSYFNNSLLKDENRTNETLRKQTATHELVQAAKLQQSSRET